MKNLYQSKKVWFVPILTLVLFLMTACGSSEGSIQENSTETVTNVDNSHNLIISHFLPGNHPLHELLEDLANDLDEQTNGRITSELYPAGAIGDPGAQYDMAVTGTADITLSVHGFTPGRFPLVTVVELPFLANSAEIGSKIIWTLYNEFPDLRNEHRDTTPLWLHTAEPAQLLSANKRIETPEDLRGLRVRSPSPLASQIIEQLGATPISMPMGEVYDALQRGVVDVAMAPFSTLHDYSFHEVVKYVTVGDFSPTPFYAVMNTDTYNSLSNADRELINSLTGMTMAKKAGYAFDLSALNGIKVSEESNVVFIELTGDKLTPWKEALEPIILQWISDMEQQGYPGQEIYDRAAELGAQLN